MTMRTRSYMTFIFAAPVELMRLTDEDIAPEVWEVVGALKQAVRTSMTAPVIEQEFARFLQAAYSREKRILIRLNAWIAMASHDECTHSIETWHDVQCSETNVSLTAFWKPPEYRADGSGRFVQILPPGTKTLPAVDATSTRSRLRLRKLLRD